MWLYHDGGRKEAGYDHQTGDCVARAIAIATSLPYQGIYDAINCLAHEYRHTKQERRLPSRAESGVHAAIYDRLLKDLGWDWARPRLTTCLNPDSLPPGRLVCRVGGHLVAAVDRIVYDTHDCTEGGARPLIGYYYGEPIDCTDGIWTGPVHWPLLRNSLVPFLSPQALPQTDHAGLPGNAR